MTRAILVSRTGYTTLFQVYAASLRLAVALVCVGVGLILGGIWLGLIPDESVFDERQRQQRCEQITLTTASLIRHQQWNDLSRILQVMVDQDDDLVAIAIETEKRQLRVVRSKDGEQPDPSVSSISRTWPPSRARDLPRTMPIKLDGVIHGTAEFYHGQALPAGWRRMATHPVVRMLAFFIVGGVGMYTVFVIHLMRSFEVTQVVPDRVRQALDTLSEGLLVMDERERIILANHSFSKTVGLSREALVGKRAGSLPWVCSATTTVADYPWVRALRESQPQTEQLMRYRLPDGKLRFFSINTSPIESPESTLRGTLATFRDVTEFEEHRAQLEHMLAMLRNSRDEISTKNRELEILATQDELTGCLNRRALFDGFETLWHHAQQQETSIACLMIDIDHFKSVNDNHGHHIGDEVLRRVSAVLMKSFSDPSMVCRYGGEEFSVILPGKTLDQAVEEAGVARASIASMCFDEPPELRITVSIGVSELGFGAVRTSRID